MTKVLCLEQTCSPPELFETRVVMIFVTIKYII